MKKTISWKSFNPQKYLCTYYDLSRSHKLPSDEVAIIKLQLKILDGGRFSRAVDIGCGPTIHHSIVPSVYTKELFVADYLSSNIREVQKWIANEEGAFNWDMYIREVLKIELSRSPTTEELLQRKMMLRKTLRPMSCNIKKASVLGQSSYLRSFDLVMSYYCADSATSSRFEFQKYIENIMMLAKPGATFIFSMLHDAKHYSVGSRNFPSVSAEPDYVSKVFGDLKTPIDSLDIGIVNVAEFINEGFSSILLISGKTRK